MRRVTQYLPTSTVIHERTLDQSVVELSLQLKLVVQWRPHKYKFVGEAVTNANK